MSTIVNNPKIDMTTEAIKMFSLAFAFQNMFYLHKISYRTHTQDTKDTEIYKKN